MPRRYPPGGRCPQRQGSGGADALCVVAPGEASRREKFRKSRWILFFVDRQYRQSGLVRILNWSETVTVTGLASSPTWRLGSSRDAIRSYAARQRGARGARACTASPSPRAAACSQTEFTLARVARMQGFFWEGSRGACGAAARDAPRTDAGGSHTISAAVKCSSSGVACLAPAGPGRGDNASCSQSSHVPFPQVRGQVGDRDGHRVDGGLPGLPRHDSLLGGPTGRTRSGKYHKGYETAGLGCRSGDNPRYLEWPGV